MGRLSGRVSALAGGGGAVRVLAVRGDRLVAEAPVGADGSWALELEGTADWLVFRWTGDRIGAVAVDPSEPQPGGPPEFARVRLTLTGALPGAMLWLDPEALADFPDELLWTLRAHVGEVIDLHVGEWTADRPTLELHLQPGRYRLSGGLIAVRSWETGQAVVEVADAAGRALVPSAGEMILTVAGDADHTVRFGRPT